jgi:hypothetical protein
MKEKRNSVRGLAAAIALLASGSVCLAGEPVKAPDAGEPTILGFVQGDAFGNPLPSAQQPLSAKQEMDLAQIRQAVNDWEATTRARDSGYARKKFAVYRFAQALVQQRGTPHGAQEAVSLIQEAYTEATREFTREPLPSPPGSMLQQAGSRRHAPTNAQGPCKELWGSSCYGMSVAEVLKAVPQAAQKLLDTYDHINSGAENLVDGPVQVIDGAQFIPHFYFSAGRLEQVNLSLNSTPVSGSFAQGIVQAAFADITVALRAKYGNEINTVEVSPQLPDFQIKEWLHNGTNIMVLLANTPNQTAIPALTITYQRRLETNSGKL